MSADDAHVQAGRRLYENLSDAQKMVLSHTLRECLEMTHARNGAARDACAADVHGCHVSGRVTAAARGESGWQCIVDDAVTRVLARRAASGESLELCDVVAEVLPMVRSGIPDSAREQLFRCVTATLAEAD